MKKAVLYARVYSMMQHRLIDMQMQEMQSYCEANGIEIVARFSEVGTGLTFECTERPGFASCMDFIEANQHDIDYFLCFSSDRFSRESTNAEILQLILWEMGIAIIPVSEPHTPGEWIDFKGILSNNPTKKLA